MASQKSSEKVARVSDGFVSVGSIADARWFHLATGNSMVGRLLGMHERQDARSKTGKSKFFQLQLQSECKVRDGRGEDAEIVTASEGDIINLNYGPKTEVLEKFCDECLQGAVYDVKIAVGKKISLRNGNTMWNITVAVKRLKKANADANVVTDFEGGSEDAALSEELDEAV